MKMTAQSLDLNPIENHGQTSDRFHTSFCHEGLRRSIRNPRSDKSGKEFCGMNGFVTVGTCNFIQSLQGPVLEFARSNHVNLNLFIIEFRE